MPRKQKKYHYIYKTTCKITGKFYVGMHSSNSLDDGYLGSGKILGYSRHKYGDENHTREILEFCVSREELKFREKEVVNEELLNDPLNINLKYGGEGGSAPTGSGFWNETHKLNFTRAGWKAMNSIKNKTEAAKKAADTFKKRYGKNSVKYKIKMKALKKATLNASSEAAIKKRKLTMLERGNQTGNKNYAFGKKWINDGEKCIRVEEENIQKYLNNGYAIGRIKRK